MIDIRHLETVPDHIEKGFDAAAAKLREESRSKLLSIRNADKHTKSMPRAMTDDDVHGNLQFGPFELSSRERVLRRDGVVLPLGSRAFDILIYLAERPGEVIAKRELIDHVWSDVTVEEGSLRVHVAAIRKALSDGQFGNRYIANVKGRGYSFVGTVVPLTGPMSRLELLRLTHMTAVPRHRTRALGCVLFSRRPLLYDQHWGPVRRWR